MSNRVYAREVTKEYLQKLGVEHVSTDGTEVIVFGQVARLIPAKNNKQGTRHYYNVRLYDEESDRIFDAGVHVLNYVWNKATKPQGMIIDHIDNNADNNDISNLQCITPRENVNKERSGWHTSEIKCQLSKPRSYYENKLAGYELAYEQAKKDHDAKTAHLMRCNTYQMRARLRYYDSHIEEARAIQEAKELKEKQQREYHERAQTKRELQYAVDRARKFYKQVRDAYGEDDEYVKKCWGEWKLAIAMLHGFCAENKISEK